MDLDVKKTNPTPKDKYQAIEFMCEAQKQLVDAIFIMNSIVTNPSEEYKELHERKIKKFIKQFEK